MCAASATDRCTGVTGDGGTGIDASCGWSVANFDACAAGIDAFGDERDWTIPVTATVTIDTDNAMITASSGAAFPANGYRMQKVQIGGGSALTLVLGVHDLAIDGNVTVMGDNPLLVVASGIVSIGGTIQVLPASAGTPGCNGGNGGGGSGSQSAAGGGAGASFGGAGAMGGAGSTPSATPGEGGGTISPALASNLVPLRGGCAGGRGGTWINPNIAGGLGGRGGNGIQISARTMLRFTAGGTIVANGEGGKATSAPRPSHGGGGGGGSGGGILLEAPTIDLTSAKLCAHGGGGAASFSGGAGMTATTCAVTAPGGGVPGAPASGGAGAANALSAVAGSPGTPNTPEGGGGGGGGLGRIRAIGTTTGTPMIVSPPLEQ